MAFVLQPQNGRLPKLKRAHEWEIFCYAAHGVPSAEIATELGLSYGFVKNVRSHIRDILGIVGNKGEFVTTAIAAGVLELPKGEELLVLREIYDNPELFSPLHKAIMRDTAAGELQEDIAKSLHLKRNTLKSHLSQIKDTLNIHTIAGLTRAQMALDKEQQRTAEPAHSGGAYLAADLLPATETFAAHRGFTGLSQTDNFTDRVKASRAQQTRHWR